MIWEVDEDCDQAVNWEEFQAMYHRCNNDQAGEGCLQSSVRTRQQPELTPGKRGAPTLSGCRERA